MSAPDLAGMDAQARRFLAMVGLGAGDVSATLIEDRRRSFEKLMRFSRPPEAKIATADRSIARGRDAVPVRLYDPDPACAVMPGLLYFHGGGLVAGSIDTHDGLCRSLAHEAICRVVSVDYRLAPEHPFPSAIVDALVVARYLLRRAGDFGIDPGRIAVGGDSGGATLAAIVAQVMRSRAGIKAQILLCPVLDFGGRHMSRETFGSGFLLDTATMASDLAHYAPRRSLDDPRISPLHGERLGGLPTTIIHTAGFDPLRDEGAAYAARLRAAGVKLAFTCHDALIHHFYGLTGVVPAARTALSAIAEDIKAVLA